jgi:hypothetical protein
MFSLELAPSPGDLAFFGEIHPSNAVLGCGCGLDGGIADCCKRLGEVAGGEGENYTLLDGWGGVHVL